MYLWLEKFNCELYVMEHYGRDGSRIITKEYFACKPYSKEVGVTYFPFYHNNIYIKAIGEV